MATKDIKGKGPEQEVTTDISMKDASRHELDVMDDEDIQRKYDTILSTLIARKTFIENLEKEATRVYGSVSITKTLIWSVLTWKYMRFIRSQAKAS